MCVFACPERSPPCLFSTHDYFCPLPGAVSCFIFQVTDKEHFSSSTEQPGTVPGTRVGCSAQPWQTKGFVLPAPAHSSTSHTGERSIFNLSCSGNQRGGIKTRAVTDFRRRSLSCFIWYNEQENQSKVRGPVYLFFQQFLWCQFTRYYNNGTHGR